MNSRRLPPVLLAAALLALGYAGRGTNAVGQPADVKPGSAPQHDMVGTQHCIGCHTGNADSEVHKAYKSLGIDKFIRLDEYAIWHRQDIHANAYACLIPKKSNDGKENIAAKMEKTLNELEKKPEDKKPLVKRQECLACHSQPATDMAASSDEKLDHLFKSVSCEGCHGAAEHWLGEHVVQSKWHILEPGMKSAKGLVDLRDPQVRAEKCASCHIGNLKKEGKFVTHRMYAAGHPPLPSFELTRYQEDQPRHAHRTADNEFLRELAGRDRDAAWRLFHYRTEAEEFGEMRAFAVGAVVAFRETVRTLLDEANDETHKGMSFDLSHLNCYACHHELKLPSDRQKAGFANTPGRPVVRPLSRDLFEAVARHAKGQDDRAADALGAEIEAKVADFQKGFDVPFGDRSILAAKGRELLALSTTVLAELESESIRYNQAETARLFAVLKRVAGERLAKSKGYLDHDTAQQIVRGLEAVRNQLAKGDAKYKGDGSASPGELFKDLDWTRLTKEESTPREEIFRSRMDGIEKFDSERFRTTLDTYFKLLP